MAPAASRAFDRPEGNSASLTAALARRPRPAAVATARRHAAAVYPQPRTTIEGRCRAEEAAPHTLSAHAGRSLVSRNRRGSPSPGVPATSNCGDGGVLRGWDTTTSTRRLATPPWHRRAGVWTGCLVGREHARAPPVDVAGTPKSMTPRRFRDTSHRYGVLRQDVRGNLFSLQRPSIVVTGPRDTRAERRRATDAERRRASAASASASSYNGRAATQPRRGTISSNTIRQPSGRRCQIRA